MELNFSQIEYLRELFNSTSELDKNIYEVLKRDLSDGLIRFIENY